MFIAREILVVEKVVGGVVVEARQGWVSGGFCGSPSFCEGSLRFLRSPSPGPFSNGPYGVAFPLVVHERVMVVGWEM